MKITGSRVLVLGGWGLVGNAVCKKILSEKPSCLIVTSLNEKEANDAQNQLQTNYPDIEIKSWSGNIFGRNEYKHTPKSELIIDVNKRRELIADIMEDLSDKMLGESALYNLLIEFKPDIVIDCINSATAIAYQDIYTSARATLKAIDEGDNVNSATENLLTTLYVPQLIRHIQILFKGLKDADSGMYLKIGTAGAGGMGLNIPYTHSEERPSRVLLSKSAVAGAHTLLLFMMARTPNGPIIKEIKPTATIAWKRIESGEVLRKGNPIPLVDCTPENSINVSEMFNLKEENCYTNLNKNLTAPFIDTGENGIFSTGEFETISSLDQMEMITPEEIAEAVRFEVMGGNSGHDVIAGLDGTVFGPTYRGGQLRERALDRLKKLEKETSINSVAFEMLGPPRLSKLLYEAHILGLVGGSIKSILNSDEELISQTAEALIKTNSDLRSKIISIGIPILLRDGVSILRGESVKIPPYRGEDKIISNIINIEEWANAGWVDLRVENILKWKIRLKKIVEYVSTQSIKDSSSSENFNLYYWENFDTMPIGKICGWIFTIEEEGARMKA